MWRFIGFPMPAAHPPFPTITSHKRAKISNDSSKFLTQFYGCLRFRKHLAMLLSISNLIYDIESISSVCVSKYTICLCGCVCVFVCFCTAVSDDFSYFAKSFYTLPFGLRFWPKPSRLLLRIVARDV